MAERLATAGVIARIWQLTPPALIGIDGLPCSGKTTLVAAIERACDVDCIYLDEFVRPGGEWPSRDRPAFPFEYIRYAEFLATVQTLAASGTCRFAPYDWATGRESPVERIVTLDRPVIIEGVSALVADLAGLYDLRIFVDSDRSTALAAALARDGGDNAEVWKNLLLPSVDLYVRTDPASRADIIVPGRGVV